MPTLTYLACPYMHEQQQVMDWRFDRVCELSAQLLREGQHTFSPISESHPIARFGLPKDWAFWKAHDEIMLSRVDALMVYCLPGWEKSVGVKAEIEIVQRLGKPIEHRLPSAEVLDSWKALLRHKSVCVEADELVNGERAAAYGDAVENWRDTAVYWTAWGHRRGWLPQDKRITGFDGAYMLMLAKVSRAANTPKRDNQVDVCGYMEVAQKCADAGEC